jgi:hypothetical protein
VLVRDLLVWLDTGRWLPLSLREAWRQFGGAPIEGIAAGPLTAWAAPVLIVLGAALLVLCRRRKARFSYRPS